MSKEWITPDLLELRSGAEAQAEKGQWFEEGSRGCAPNSNGIGCPGTPEGDLDGAS